MKSIHRNLAAALLIASQCATTGNASAETKPYEANWDSLNKRPMPAWFQDAKFGVFIQ